ncbi:MAG: tRNA (guanosine(46)-N7)-methyltransferase TrmB [Bacteroidota bacterium]
MRSKLARFEYNENAENVIQPGKDLFVSIKGNWKKEYFKNDNPLTLELACGRGEYTIGLAKQFSDRNYVGVDIKGDRIWKGSQLANEEGLTNVGFLRTFIHNMDDFVAECEVDEIWLTFPDPRPKDRDERRRLTNERFMELYKHILRPGGWFRFKTDNTGLFEYTLKALQLRKDIQNLTFTHNLAESELLKEHYGITTHYEQMFSEQGEVIKYLKFQFTN